MVCAWAGRANWEKAKRYQHALEDTGTAARLYPDARIELYFTSPLELLVAAILLAWDTPRTTRSTR